MLIAWIREPAFFLKKEKYNPVYPYKLIFFRKLDYILLYLYNTNIIALFRINFRKNIKMAGHYMYSGFFFFIKHTRYWLLPLMFLLVFFYFAMYIRALSFLKVIFEWFLIINVSYWLFSGFVFFVKKYRYNRFTSAIQRFWRRSFILFWLIESSLFIVFIYLLFNASSEPIFMFDMVQLNKQRLYSWKFFLYKSFFVFLIIILSYFLIINAKWNTFSKYSAFLLAITIILTYIVWMEFYQFFYVINWYGEIVWVFDVEDKVWYAENTFKRARIVNHYVTICVIAKFWHIIYIYLFWVFFVLRALEQRKLSYIALSANLQNFLILYLMNWLLMYPWFKFICRKFLTYNHASFHEFRIFIFKGFFCDLILYFKSVLKLQKKLNFFKKTNFFYNVNLTHNKIATHKEFIKPQLAELFLFINIAVLISVFVFI
jgi:hypothetical protein